MLSRWQTTSLSYACRCSTCAMVLHMSPNTPPHTTFPHSLFWQKIAFPANPVRLPGARVHMDGWRIWQLDAKFDLVRLCPKTGYCLVWYGVMRYEIDVKNITRSLWNITPYVDWLHCFTLCSVRSGHTQWLHTTHQCTHTGTLLYILTHSALPFAPSLSMSTNSSSMTSSAAQMEYTCLCRNYNFGHPHQVW